MRRIVSFITVLVASFAFFNYAYGDDKKVKLSKKANVSDHEFNFFTGMFDFSDDKQASGTFGIQHQNETLFIKNNRGRFSPITGAFITSKNAYYIYTGLQAEYEMGAFKITPSFAPGYYNEGNGKDLGSPLEFKTELQMTYDLGKATHIGASYNHISNASLGDKNPGANSYMFNILKRF